MNNLARFILQGNTEAIQKLVNLEFRTTVPISIKLEGNKMKVKNLYALHFSVYIGRLPVSEVLLDAGADVNAPASKHKWAPIHFAAFLNDVEHLRLLHKHKADLNIRGGMGETALHVALINKHLEFAKVLLELGADPNIANYNKTTPLHITLKTESIEAMALLMKHGGNPELVSESGTATQIAQNLQRTDFQEVLAKNSALLEKSDDELTEAAPKSRIEDFEDSDSLNIPESASDPYSRYKDPAKVLKKLGRSSFEEMPEDISLAMLQKFQAAEQMKSKSKKVEVVAEKPKKMTAKQKQRSKWTIAKAGDIQKQQQESRAQANSQKDDSWLDEAEQLILGEQAAKKPQHKKGAQTKPAPAKPQPAPKLPEKKEEPTHGVKRIDKSLKIQKASSDDEDYSEPEQENPEPIVEPILDEDDDDIIADISLPSFTQGTTTKSPAKRKPAPEAKSKPKAQVVQETAADPYKEMFEKQFEMNQKLLAMLEQKQEQQAQQAQQAQQVPMMQPPMYPQGVPYGYPMGPYPGYGAYPPADLSSLMHRIGAIEMALNPALRGKPEAPPMNPMQLGICTGCNYHPASSICPFCGKGFCLVCRESHHTTSPSCSFSAPK